VVALAQVRDDSRALDLVAAQYGGRKEVADDEDAQAATIAATPRELAADCGTMSPMRSTPRPVGRARAGRDVVAQLILRASNLVLGIAVTVVLVRTLGDEGFGQWSTLLATVGIVGYFGALGLDRVTIERAASEPERAPSWVGALVTLRLALALPVMVGTVVVCLWLANDAAMRIAAVIVGATVPVSALTAARVVFELQVRNAVTTGVEVANGILWGVAVALVAVADGGLVAVAGAFLAVTTLTSAGLLVLALRAAPVRLRASRRFWRGLLRLGVPVGIGGLLTRGYGSIDQVIVFELAGARDAGLYGAVYRIFERMQFLPGSLMITLFPIIVAARDADPERVKRIFHLAIDYLALISLPAFAIALAGPEQLVRALFGAQFSDSAPALPVLMAAFVLVSLGFLAGHLIIAYELQRRFVRIALGALVFNVAANLALVPRFGFMAAAVMTLATELLVTGLTLTLVCRRMDVRPTGPRVAPIALAAAAVGGAGWGLRVAGAPTAVWAGVAALLYPALLFALGVVRLAEVRDLVRWRGP
jgi:O-antigen/teichoic acid export membrane protein